MGSILGAHGTWAGEVNAFSDLILISALLPGLEGG